MPWLLFGKMMAALSKIARQSECAPRARCQLNKGGQARCSRGQHTRNPLKTEERPCVAKCARKKTRGVIRPIRLTDGYARIAPKAIFAPHGRATGEATSTRQNSTQHRGLRKMFDD